MITVIIEDEPDIPQKIETPEKALPDTDTLQTFQEQEAVIRGAPVDKILVLAGPGTGKTYCLIERIKFMVEEDGSVDPENILLLCFTRAAVREIKDRFRLPPPGHHRSRAWRIEQQLAPGASFPFPRK